MSSLIFSEKMNIYFGMLSAAVVIGTLRVENLHVLDNLVLEEGF